MSVELLVLSAVQVAREALVQGLAAHGWSARIVSAHGKSLLRGAIEDELVLGWCTGWADSPREPFDFADLSPTHYAAVPVRAARTDARMIELAGGGSPSPLAHTYVVWTSARRTSLAASLQRAIWGVLGDMTGGRLFSEVTGEFVDGAAVVEPAPGGPEVVCGSIGSSAPAVELTAHDGARVSLRTAGARPAVIWFLPAQLTKNVVGAAQVFARFQSALMKRATVIGVGRSTDAVHRSFAQESGLQFPLLSDPSGSVADAFGAHGDSLLVRVDAQGVIRDRLGLTEPAVTLLRLTRQL